MYADITIDAWVKVTGDCPVKYEINGDEAQVELGTSASCLSLGFTEEGLELVAAKLSAALADLRAAPAA